MNKHDIVEKIAKEAGITKTTAAAAVQSLINAVTKSLKKGDPVSFVGFGTFKIANRRRAPHSIRGPARPSRFRSAACPASRPARLSSRLSAEPETRIGELAEVPQLTNSLLYWPFVSRPVLHDVGA